MSETVRWWHYTLARTLAEILVSGAIKRSTEGVSEGERTAVWFSCRTDWEPTATRGLTDGRTGERRTATIEEMVALGGELVRLEVPETVARYTWADHRRLGQIDPRMADGLERALGGEPAKWRLSYDDVPLNQIVNIEVSPDGRSWRSVDKVGWWNNWRDEPAKSLEPPAEAALPGLHFDRDLIVAVVILIAVLFGAWLGLR